MQSPQSWISAVRTRMRTWEAVAKKEEEINCPSQWLEYQQWAGVVVTNEEIATNVEKHLEPDQQWSNIDAGIHFRRGHADRKNSVLLGDCTIDRLWASNKGSFVNTVVTCPLAYW